MLIFNEDKQYKNLMENGFEKYPNKRDLIILCRGWLKVGMHFESLKDNIIDFCTKWNSEFNYAKSEMLILSVLKDIEANTTDFNFNTNIVYSENEVNFLLNIKDFKLQKVLFVIMTLAKWRNANYIYLNSGSSIKVKDIFNLARLKLTGKEQKEILYKLNSQNFINVQLKPLLKVIIPCIDIDIKENNAKINFLISDDFIDEWLNLVLPHCDKCGKPFEKRGNKQKYCKCCAKIVKNEQNKSYLKLGK